MSYRDKLFLEKTLPFIKDNWEFKNFLFGGVTDLSTKSQMDFIDVFYFLGIIGGGLYLYLYYKSFFTFKTNLEVKLLLSLLLVIVFVAGNFFAYPSIVIYLFILKELLIHDNERNQEYLNKND
ncbi:MAG: hypothetical protein KAH07_03485 [Flavobacteriaceae bacterium]|nr:hypothetical protein [Flavobacteriaceae bacterium]